jgi:hypothetical protein
MDDDEFLARVSKCDEELIGHEEDCSRYECWCALYLEATPQQRLQLPGLFAPRDTGVFGDRLGYLTMCIRAVSKRIQSPEDVHPLRLGLAAAAILQEGIDSRDILISLSFLYIRAIDAGIDPIPYFKEASASSGPVTSRLINGLLSCGEATIREQYQQFSGGDS